jgi:membrane protease YdiL (CAAX protease family)
MEESPDQGPQDLTSFWYHRGEFRAVWKVSVYGTLAFFATLFLGIGLYTMFPQADWRLTTPLLTLFAALLASLFCAVTIDRKPVLDLIGLRPGSRGWKQLLLGFGIALALQLLLLGTELLFGGARMLSGHVTLAHTLSLLLYGLLSFTLVGFAEEVLVRGYAFQVLRTQGGVVTALLLTSGLFSLMHAMNPGIGWIGFLNIFLAGIWLGAARVTSGSLWLPVGMHIGWNFFLGPVFGFPVSGIIERSVLITRPAGADWITGGAFGPEGGVLATIVLLAGAAALFHPGLRVMTAMKQEAPMYTEINEVQE